MEQRANIQFCFKTGKTATETYQLIKQAYGDNALSRTRVYEWYARYWDGRENLENDERNGPTTVRTPDMIETVREMISSDRRMTLRMMEEEELTHLIQIIRRVRPQLQERGSWFLLHDNTSPHTAVSIKQILAIQGIPELNPPPPPYSPDLSPPVIFLFPKIKSTVNGRRFEDAENIKKYNRGIVGGTCK
jgi:hypothetical protein